MATEKNWFPLSRTAETGKPGATALLNLDLVQSVEIISDRALKLRYSENQTISIEGKIALDLVRYLMTKTVHLDQDQDQDQKKQEKA
jgi:hypothetical protein